MNARKRESMILFLAICSLNKEPGGVSEYDERDTIIATLSPTLRRRTLDRRERVRQLVVGSLNAKWQGVPLSALPYNASLKRGADFGGADAATYLPAIQRYDGRFFQSLGVEGRHKLGVCGHHVLLMSGLYGLLLPNEPIQLYSCPLLPQVARAWQDDDLLTEVLCEFVEKHGIAKIIDLTAVDAYRKRIDWGEVARAGTEVLHCFDTMAAGDYTLVSFGKLLGTQLVDQSEDELVDLASETAIGTVVFRSLSKPDDGMPQEESWLKEEDILTPRPLTALEEAFGGGNPEVEEVPGARLQEGFSRFATTSRFDKDLRKLYALFTKIVEAAIEICQDPLTPCGNTIKPLTGDGPLKGCWRYRLGDYRIVYRPDKEKQVVFFRRVAPRSSVYE